MTPMSVVGAISTSSSTGPRSSRESRGCAVNAAGCVQWRCRGRDRAAGSRLAFEAFVITLAASTPMAAIARLVGEHDTRLWRLVRHHVDEARTARDDSAVTAVGIDETSSRRGHHYISLFVDLEARRLLFATPGHEAATVHRFAADLMAHGGDPAQITEVCCGGFRTGFRSWGRSRSYG